jgi:putative iron-regulated protein
MSTPTRVVLLLLAAPPFAPAQDSRAAPTEAAVAAAYASFAYAAYEGAAVGARDLKRAVDALVERPSAETLDLARRAWIAGRRAYGRTEVLRFYSGPIDDPNDGVETTLNAWPIDESYVDAVAGRPKSGIVHDVVRFPTLAEETLLLANERGGETAVTVGWHAIEFLLWGQDLNPDGPGSRPHGDYVVGVGANAARRGTYLRVATELLVSQTEGLARAWGDDPKAYRRAFEADPRAALKKILTGAVVLSGFEMAGERLAVAYETRDQEHEHSCFSDTTHVDFEANQAGVVAALTGRLDGVAFGPGAIDLLRAKAPDLAALLERRLEASTAALAAVPIPFDVAILGGDSSPGRVAVRRAIEALEAQAEAIAIMGRTLGHVLPLKP